MRLTREASGFERQLSPVKFYFQFSKHRCDSIGLLEAARARDVWVAISLSIAAIRREFANGSMVANEAGLSPDAELIDQRAVTREIGTAQILKQTAAFSHQSKQTAARMMVLHVGFEMLRQLLDASTHERNLNFGGAAVIGSASVRLNNFPLSGTCQRHQDYLLSLLPFINHGILTSGGG
jgi:hypothetical protein